jgi:hypothetical protein
MLFLYRRNPMKTWKSRHMNTWVFIIVAFLAGWLSRGQVVPTTPTQLKQMHLATSQAPVDTRTLENHTPTPPPVAPVVLPKTKTVQVSTPKAIPAPFPKTLNEIVAGDSILATVPRDRQHIIAKVNDDGVTTVYAVVPKELLPKGSTAWDFYKRFGGVDTFDHRQYPATARMGRYHAYLAVLQQLNKDGVARNVAKHGWESFQHGDTLVPLLVQHKTHVADIVAWKHSGTSTA